jgi:hypothetical protein
MDALGRLLKYRHLADNGYIRLDNAQHAIFFCYLTGAVGDTYTLTEAKTAGGGSAQVLARITRFFTSTGDGSDAWVLRTQAAASTMVTAAAATQNAAALEVDANSLSAGYKYIKLASTGAGLVTAVQTDLADQRTPPNLPAVGV